MGMGLQHYSLQLQLQRDTVESESESAAKCKIACRWPGGRPGAGTPEKTEHMEES